MEQHPVPQHIASFEFKLFGNLTVRQFVTLAIPMGIAALIFFSNLLTIIRLPLALIFGLLGLFAALVPVGGRPFDKWVVAFIKAILSPTQRVWIKEQKLPEFLNIVVSAAPGEEKIPETITTQGRERLFAYLRSLPKGEISPFDVKEQVALGRLNLESAQGLADLGQLPKPIIWPTAPYKGIGQIPSAPTAKEPTYAESSLPQVNSVPPLSMAQTLSSEEYPEKLKEALPPFEPYRKTAAIAPHAKPYVLPGLEKKLGQGFTQEARPIELIKTPVTRLASDVNFSIENIIPIRTPGRRLKFLTGVGKTRVRKLHFGPPENFDLSKLSIRGEARFEISDELKKQLHFLENLSQGPLPKTKKVIPKTLTGVSIKPSSVKAVPKVIRFVPKPIHGFNKPKDVSFKPQEEQLTDSKMTISDQKKVRASPASILPRAQIVPLTNRPNVISGLIADASGTPLEGAIVVVRDQNGIPLRALKTNKLGQFLSATSLNDGTYSIEIESELVKFNPITINLIGQVLAPLEIKAKNQFDWATGEIN